MLNPTEEARFAKLKALCRELKVPAPPEIMIGLQVHDHNGVLTFDDIQRGHSWTRNYYTQMFTIGTHSGGGDVNAFGAGYMTAKQVDATLRYNSTGASGDISGYSLAGRGLYENVTTGTFGIKIGTSDTAFSAEHHTLQAVIPAGTGSGQMSHAAMTQPTLAYTAGTKTWKTTHSRIFNNNSGGSITVKETGLYSYRGILASLNNFMTERSVLDPTVPVANGAQLSVTYEISMDFSAID
jgi:hypothetical protein